MRTKAQIARQMYGTTLSNLSAGEKAAVTRRYNQQNEENDSIFVSEPTNTTSESTQDYITVKFGRPSVNGLKECLVMKETTVQSALDQSGLKINKTKEGVLEKESGRTVSLNETVEETTYVIVPGIDSSK